MTGDPLADLDHDTDSVECDVCGDFTEVDVSTHITTGRWERVSWECVCGEHHGAIDGNVFDRADRGSTTVLMSVFVLGLLIVTGTLAHLFTVPPTPGHLYLLLTGAGLMAAVFTIAVTASLTQKDHS